MGSKLDKVLEIIKEGLEKAVDRKVAKKNMEAALKRARENKNQKVIRRRNNQDTKLDVKSEAEKEQMKAQKELENKMRNDKGFKDAAKRSNQEVRAKARSAKAKELIQNRGYDRAVQDETKGVPETVGTKKRSDKYINQMNRRKEAGTQKLIDKEGEFKKSLQERWEDLKKAMNNAGLGGPGSVKAGAVLPSVNTLVPKPGNNSNASKMKMPGVNQPSKKNPLKSIEQTQNKDIKDLKMKEAQSALKAKAPEMIKFEKNGQWSLQKDSADPKLAPKDRKVKELQSQIDAGTYKPDASKIAGAMLKPLKEGNKKLKKSGYKGYKVEDNVRRKAKNLGEETDIKAMSRIKEYGGSGPSAATREAAKAKKMSAKNEVKWTHEHPETGETVTVSMSPRKMKNYQKKMKALANEKKSKS